jgi:hypothetical protein
VQLARARVSTARLASASSILCTAGRIDPFDPDNFKYEIKVKEIG